MKTIYTYLILLLVLAAGCKKEEQDAKEPALINVVNAAIGTGTIKFNPGTDNGFTWAKIVDQVSYGSNFNYQGFVGTKSISIVSTADTTKTLIKSTVNLKPIQTLYLIGQSPDTETMLVEEPNLPFILAAKVNPDSSTYIRFVNLVPNSPKMRVNIRATPDVNEVTDLGYKDISAFKKYEAKTTTTAYFIEFRDVATNTVLASYNFDTRTIGAYRHKTISVVLRGLIGGSGASAPGITLVINL